MAKKSVREQVAPSKCKEVDITIPSLSDSEYVALIKNHYISLADKVIIGSNGPSIPMWGFSREMNELIDFAGYIGIYNGPGSELPLTKSEIEAYFQNYKSEILPRMESKQEYYSKNKKKIVLDIVSKNWKVEQKRKFSERYFPEFRKLIHEDFDKTMNKQLYSYGDFTPRGYKVTDNPKGHLIFLIKKDGFQQPVYINCELEPNNPEKFKKGGYYLYDDTNDTYKLKSFNVSGPFEISWENLFSKQDRRDIYEFVEYAVRNLGVIHLKYQGKNAIDTLFPETIKTIENDVLTKIKDEIKEIICQELPSPSVLKKYGFDGYECLYYWDIDNIIITPDGKLKELEFSLIEESLNGCYENFTSLRFHYNPKNNIITLPTLNEILSGKYDVDAPIHRKVADKNDLQVIKLVDFTPILKKYKSEMTEEHQNKKKNSRSL